MDADINLKRGTRVIHDPSLNKTGADGKHIVSIGKATSWTKMNGSTVFDVDPYIASAWKHRGPDDSTLYELQSSSAFHVYSTVATAGTPAERTALTTMTLDEINGVFTVGVTAKDMHNNASIETTVNAKPTNHADDIGLGPDNVITTPGTLRLYSKFGTYQVCAGETSLYRSELNLCQTRSTGTSVDLAVRRQIAFVYFQGIDPHTGWHIIGFNATATNATGEFWCNPQGDATDGAPYFCTRQTNSTTTPLFNILPIPWTSSPDELCLVSAAKASAAVAPGTANPTAGESVPWKVARICRAWAPGPNFVNMSPLRDANAVALAGSVVDASGRPMPAASLHVTAERAEDANAATPTTFICNPATHHSVGAYSDCDRAPGADGRYTMTLPAIGNTRTWTVTATAPEHYVETYFRWPNNAAVATGDFVLYPKEFEVIITITDTNGISEHVCGARQSRPVQIEIIDLADDDADIDYHANATSQNGKCVATVSITQWHRDPSPMPAAANRPWPKDTNPFLINVAQLDHAGAVVETLGPADSERKVEIRLVHLNPTTPGGTFQINGRVYDGDGLAETSGAIGVPSQVTATVTSGDCSGSFQATTGSDGAYTISVPCAGTYSIVAEPFQQIRTHWTTANSEVTLTAAVPTAAKDVPVARVRTNLLVTVNGQTEGVIVDPTPIAMATDPEPRTSRFGFVTFTNIPWGAYVLEATTAERTAIPTPVFVNPSGGSTATVFIV